MKFSAQEEYGLRVLLQLARTGSMTINEVSNREGITTTHAAKLLMILRKEGFVTSTRGHTGGYTLAKKPAEIFVGDLLSILGGKLYDDEFCNKHTGALDICTHAVDCSVRSLWQHIQKSVDAVLDKLTLADMMAPDEKTNVTFFELPRREIDPIGVG
jgi:Rrf2 family protein